MSQLLLAAEAVLSDTSTSQQRAEASNYLQNQTSNVRTYEDVISTVESRADKVQRAEEDAVDVLLFVLLRQGLFSNWNKADDAYQSTGDVQRYGSWLAIVTRVRTVCYQVLSSSNVKLSPAQKTACQILALLLKKGFVLPKLWKGLNEEAEVQFGFSCTSWFDGALGDVLLRPPTPDNLAAQTALSWILDSFVEACHSTDNVSALGLSYKLQLIGKTALEKQIIPAVALYISNELTTLVEENRTEIITARDDTMIGIHLVNRLRVLLVALECKQRWVNWDDGLAQLAFAQGMRFGVSVANTPEIKLIETERAPKGNLFDTICFLDEHSSLNPQCKKISSLVTSLLLSLAAFRGGSSLRLFAHIADPYKELGSDVRRMTVISAVFIPLLDYLITRANGCCDRLRQQVSGDTVRALTHYVDIIQATLNNPDCSINQMLAPPRDSGNMSAGNNFNVSLVRFFLSLLQLILDFFHREPDLADELIGMYETVSSVFAYVAYNISGTCLPSDWEPYAKLIEPYIAVMLERSWLILEVDSLDDIDEEKDDQEAGEGEVSGELYSKSFDLQDSKTYTRIGHFAEVCRLAPAFTANLVLMKLRSLMERSTSLTSKEQDFLHICFFLMTALMTDEPKCRNFPSTAAGFYGSCGQFTRTKGAVPWALRRQPISRDDAPLAAFFEYLISASQAIMSKTSPVVQEALMVFAIRVALTYSLLPPQRAVILSEDPPVLFPRLTPATSPALEFMLKLCLYVIVNLPGEPQLVSHALLGLRSAVDLDSLLQPYLWDIPMLKSFMISVLQDPLGSQILRGMPPRLRCRLMGIFAMMSCPSCRFPEESLTDEQEANITAQMLKTSLNRQSELLAACAKLKEFSENRLEETSSVTQIALLKGIARGYLKMSTEHCRSFSFRVIQLRATYWFFNQTPLTGDWEPDGIIIADTTWLQRIAMNCLNAPIAFLSQVSGLLKALLDLVMAAPKVSEEERGRLFVLCGDVLKAQVQRVEQGTNMALEEEKLNWVRNILWLIQRLVAATNLSGTASQDEFDYFTVENKYINILHGCTIPFFRHMGQVGLNLLDPDVPDQAHLFITYMKCLSKCINTMPVFCVGNLSTDEFVTSTIKLISLSMDKTTYFRLEAEDLVFALVMALIDVSLAAAPAVPSEVMCWRRYLASLLTHLADVSISERLSSSKASSVASIMCCTLLAFCPNPDHLAELLSGTAKQIESRRPLMKAALETHFQKFYKFALDAYAKRNSSASRGVANLAFRHQALSSFRCEIFEPFTIDCRVSESA